jgi:hypothetical protein
MVVSICSELALLAHAKQVTKLRITPSTASVMAETGRLGCV